MKIRHLALGAAFLFAACGAPPPSASAPEAELALQLDPPPIHALIGHRAQLDLSSEQIEHLDLLGQEIHTENHPLLMEISGVDFHRSNIVVRQEVMTLAGQVHLNNHRAMERVRSALTENQQSEVCALFPGGYTTRAVRTVSSSDYTLRTVNRPTTYVNVGPQRANGSVWSWCNEGVGQQASR